MTTNADAIAPQRGPGLLERTHPEWFERPAAPRRPEWIARAEERKLPAKDLTRQAA